MGACATIRPHRAMSRPSTEKLGLPIQHALNGGEKKFIRYWVDGYIEEYNICIEWDEKQHEYKKYKEKDIVREQFLKENHHCHLQSKH